MPNRNRNGGLHRGRLFDTNVPSTSIDKDIFTDQEVEDTIAGDDLVLMLDVSEDPDKIKYMTRTNFTAGLSGTTITVTDNESTNENNLITFVAGAATTTGLHGIEMDGDLTYNPSSGTLTATTFLGNLTGNASGTAASLASGRTIGMTGDVAWTSASFDGSGNVTGSSTIQSSSVESSMLNNDIVSGQTEISSGLAAEDELLYSDDGALKKVGVDTLASKFAGAGMTATSAVVNVIGGDGITANANDVAVTAAQTTITSIYATDLIMGEDAQTAIDFGTANEIDFKADNAARITLSSSALYPVTDNEIDLGTASLEFKDAFFDGTVTSDAFAGPLTGDVTGNADTVTTNANLTGHVTSIGNAAVLGSFTSAQLATALTNETGSGAAVFATSPTLVTPALGTPASGVATNLTGTAASLTAGTATVATTVTITDNENTSETNAIIFTAGGDLDGGDLGLESDGDLTYNPSSGLLSSTGVTASDTVTFGSLSDGAITATAFVDEDNMASNSATLIPTQQSVKAYVDSSTATGTTAGFAVAMAIAL